MFEIFINFLSPICSMVYLTYLTSVPVHSEIAWKFQDDHLELAAGGEYLGAAGPPETLKSNSGKTRGVLRDLI